MNFTLEPTGHSRERNRIKREHAEGSTKTSRPIYGWFTEEFDTANLNEARTLLDELS